MAGVPFKHGFSHFQFLSVCRCLVRWLPHSWGFGWTSFTSVMQTLMARTNLRNSKKLDSTVLLTLGKDASHQLRDVVEGVYHKAMMQSSVPLATGYTSGEFTFKPIQVRNEIDHWCQLF